MFNRKANSNVGRIKITIETDMTVAREYFRLIGDAPKHLPQFVRDVVMAISDIADMDKDSK